MFLFPACKNLSGGEQINTEHHREGQKTEEAEHGGPGSLQLNNGAKWQANPETSAGIAQMKMHVKELSANPTEADYDALKRKLVAELNLVFQKCTMTGESHNQLHHYLLPLKELIDDLDEGSVDKSAKVLEQIRNTLNNYDYYFS
jgi:hypothetical protein